MFVHPSTFRYRLRRLTEVSGIDLSDPEQRFAAMLQLRAVYPAAGRRLCMGSRAACASDGGPLRCRP